MAIAIIPARGGSKRIPRKNIRPFCGLPMIAYAIEAARDSGCFSRVVVSTDDPEIAEVARRLGADVPFLRSFGAHQLSGFEVITEAISGDDQPPMKGQDAPDRAQAFTA